MRSKDPRYYTATFDKKTHRLIGIDKYALKDPSMWISHWSEDIRIDKYDNKYDSGDSESMVQFYDKYLGDVYIETFIVER